MYTPNNQKVFLQAFAGAVAGLLGQSTPLTTTRGSYTATLNIANAWAQSVDTQWASALDPDEFEYTEIAEFSNDLFMVFEPQVGSTAPAFFTKTANALLTMLADAEAVLAAEGITPGAPGGNENYVYITNGSSLNGQGVGGPTTVALVSLKAKGSGIFRWSATAVQAGAAAGETVDFVVTSQTGTGAESFTGGATAVGGSGPSEASTINLLTSNGVAGTGIAVTGGGGGELTQYTDFVQIGTAAIGAKFSAGGIMQNSVTAQAPRVPFPLGNNVMLLVKITNSTTNRLVTGICVSLEEMPN
jgi:hypothetical protein